jgi:glycosyltransferase involved in cell wall biosynthesis
MIFLAQLSLWRLHGDDLNPVCHPLTPQPLPELLSIVIPAYNEEEVVEPLRQRLGAFLGTLPCSAEVILVNDGSNDRTLERFLKWAEEDSRIRVIGLARNFGHQAAITAGLDSALGDAVVIMDADLQDPPEVVLDMLRQYAKGYDVVYGQRSSRSGEGIFKRISAWIFYRFMRTFIHKGLPADSGDFRLISRRCLDALKSMRETHRFLRGMVAWVGFPQTAVSFERPPRVAGTTKYNLAKMLHFAWTAAVSFSPAPLRVILTAGMVVAVFGLIDGVYCMFRTENGHHPLAGWTSVISVLCLVGGGILMSIGILGEYIGRIFEEVKGRPLYIVSVRSSVPEIPPPRVPELTALLTELPASRRLTAASQQTRDGIGGGGQ